MKKVLFFAALLLFVTNSFAQLVVDTTGYVRIGSESTPTSVLSVGNGNISDAGIACSHTGKYGMYINASGIEGYPSYGLEVNSSTSRHTNYGIRSIASLSGGTKPFAFGVMGQAGLSQNSIGVFGGAQGLTNIENFAGIYGTTATAGIAQFNYPGKYAGYFSGKVLATGTIYGSVSSLSSASSSSNSAPATTLLRGIEEEPVVERLAQVKNVLFNINNLNRETEEESLEDDGIYEKVHHGLDAVQLTEIYPELVEKDKEGNYRINYIELVPILVKGINELAEEIRELKAADRNKVKATSIGETPEDTDIIRMSQNNPNPFSESSVITLNIPKSAKSAAIYVYDLSGKQVDNITVSERGETNITVYASNLSAGMFIYSLVVDGKICVTRRMMVTM